MLLPEPLDQSGELPEGEELLEAGIKKVPDRPILPMIERGDGGVEGKKFAFEKMMQSKLPRGETADSLMSSLDQPEEVSDEAGAGMSSPVKNVFAPILHKKEELLPEQFAPPQERADDMPLKETPFSKMPLSKSSLIGEPQRTPVTAEEVSAAIQEATGTPIDTQPTTLPEGFSVPPEHVSDTLVKEGNIPVMPGQKIPVKTETHFVDEHIPRSGAEKMPLTAARHPVMLGGKATHDPLAAIPHHEFIAEGEEEAVVMEPPSKKPAAGMSLSPDAPIEPHEEATMKPGAPFVDVKEAKNMEEFAKESLLPALFGDDHKKKMGDATKAVAQTKTDDPLQAQAQVTGIPLYEAKMVHTPDADELAKAQEGRKVMIQLVEQLVKVLNQLVKTDRTETTIVLKHPPLFDGVTMVITEFKAAKKQFNISFFNLDNPTARQLIEAKQNQEHLREALIEKGYTLQMITIETKRDLGSTTTTTDDRRGEQKAGGGKQQNKGDFGEALDATV